jgi:hypothetical protein
VADQKDKSSWYQRLGSVVVNTLANLLNEERIPPKKGKPSILSPDLLIDLTRACWTTGSDETLPTFEDQYFPTPLPLPSRTLSEWTSYVKTTFAYRTFFERDGLIRRCPPAEHKADSDDPFEGSEYDILDVNEETLARDREASVTNMLLDEIKNAPGIEPVSNLVPISDCSICSKISTTIFFCLFTHFP